MAGSNDRSSAITWADTFEIDDDAVMSVLDNTTHRRIWSNTDCCAVCGAPVAVDLSTICLRAPHGAFSGFACSVTCANRDRSTQDRAPGR